MAYLDNPPADQPPVMDVVTDSPVEDPSAPTAGVDAEPESTPQSQAQGDDDGEQLISDEQAEALKHDPVALRKALQKAFTQKTQKLSTERKELAYARDLVAALQEDAAGTIESLARNLGLQVTKPATPDEPAADPIEEVRAALQESLGPEYEDLAERLAPALTKAVKAEAARQNAPLVAAHQQQLQEQALNEATAEMEQFGKSHPDWKEHEAEMNRLGAMLTPKPGMKPQQFLEMLYLAAKKDKAVSAMTSAALRKMQKSAEGGGRESSAVAADKVAVAPTKPLTFREAAALAQRGIRVE